MEQVSFKRLKSEDGKEYIFNSLAFKKEMKRTAVSAKEEGLVSSIEAFKEGLASKIAVSTAAIKQWESGRNGVSDIERVREIADYLGLEDYKTLLVEVKTEVGKDDQTMEKDILKAERKTARKVFNGFVEVLKMYKDTSAYAYTDGNSYGGPTKLIVILTNNKIEVMLQKARFDIAEDIHNELLRLFLDITSTLPEEIEEVNVMLRKLQVERKVDEYYKQLCKIMAVYLK